MGSQRDAPLTVTFPIPKKAASKLRTMAVTRDRRLLDLGVLAVQINKGESIVLEIKLGKQRIKKTEVSAEKIRGNASRGRVKKASARRNVATIHHMPNDFNSQAPVTHGLQAVQDLSFGNDMAKRMKVIRSDGHVVENNLFSDSNQTLSNSSESCGRQFRHVSDFTTSTASSLKAHLSSAEFSAHLKNNSEDNSNCGLEEILMNSASNVQKTLQKPSASPASVLARKTSVESLGALSSPTSQRTYTASPSSDTSSTSSEENCDPHHDQLIYDCFVDKSKYSAADMLKVLAKTHEVKNVNTSVVNREINSVANTVAIVKSTSSGRYQLKPSRVLSTSTCKNRRSVISGSYRQHVKNIRCTSLACFTSTTSTVTAGLKATASSIVDQTPGFQNRGTSIEKLLTFEGRIQNPQNEVVSLQDTKSETANIKATSSTTVMYHSGHKVLWSGANAFPKSDNSSAHFLFDKSPALGSSSSNKNNTMLSNVQESAFETAVSSCVKSDAVTWSDVTKTVSTETSSNHLPSNKLPEQELLKDINVSQTDTKLIINKMPIPSFNPHVLASSSAQETSSSHISTPVLSSSCFTATTCGNITTVCTSTVVVPNLTLGRPAAVPTPLVIAGANTQTTWSNQQVSPTYFVGAQRQYGIYSSLCNSDINNNQLGQQAVAAAYPLSYLYPLSFVYPFLTLAAQANAAKSSESSKHENKNLPVNQSEVSMDKTVHNTDSDVCVNKVNVTTTDLTPTTSTVAPPQMQFIDLASSMRYWQQLSLLYQSRLQALASCNLSNVKPLNVSTNQVNTSGLGKTSTVDSNEGAKNSFNTACKNALKSSPKKLSFSKAKISQENFPNDSTPGKTQTINFCSESLQTVKPESKLEDKNSPNKVVSGGASETLKSSMKVDNSEQKEFDINGTSPESVSFRTKLVDVGLANLHHDQLQRHTNNDSLSGLVQGGIKQSFYGPPPKLSFIHDSSIACVNVGNSTSIGNGVGSSGSNCGVRKTGFGTHVDTAIRPAKRKKSKKSL